VCPDYSKSKQRRERLEVKVARLWKKKNRWKGSIKTTRCTMKNKRVSKKRPYEPHRRKFHRASGGRSSAAYHPWGNPAGLSAKKEKRIKKHDSRTGERVGNRDLKDT